MENGKRTPQSVTIVCTKDAPYSIEKLFLASVRFERGSVVDIVIEHEFDESDTTEICPNCGQAI